ncbi:hypothetical protein RSAG8_00245, partial [Rhizoctonia solani AG-8 WAC10335]
MNGTCFARKTKDQVDEYRWSKRCLVHFLPIAEYGCFRHRTISAYEQWQGYREARDGTYDCRPEFIKITP